MHPALRSWSEMLISAFVRSLAVFCGISAASVIAAWWYQTPAVVAAIQPTPRSEWVEVDRPHPAFALSIPEATDAPTSYVIRRNVAGGGRLDIISLGDTDGAAPYLRVEVYRPGSEIFQVRDLPREIAMRAAALAPIDIVTTEEPVETKFGPMQIASFRTGEGTSRGCLAFARNYDDPRMQIFGLFCQGGSHFIERSTLACAIDRFTLLSAGSEPKVGALFAQAELKRSYCGQRNILLTPTPKHKELWGALEARAQAR